MKTRMLKYSFLIILTVLLSSYELHAQMNSLKFERYGIKHGLSSNQVGKILQDSDGYIWITTSEELNRYNGFEFTKYINNPDDSCSISPGDIVGLRESKDYMWMGTFNGILNKYDKTTGCFKKYQVDNKGVPWNHALWDIVTDGDSLVWISTEKGLVKFDVNREIFEVFQLISTDYTQFDIQDNVIYNLHQDINNPHQLFLGTRGGIFLFHKEKKQFKRYDIYSKSLVVTDILQENDSLMWAAVEDYGIVKIDRKLKKYQIYNPKSLDIKYPSANFIKKKTNVEYWVGFFDYGLSIFNSETGKFSFFKDIPYQSSSAPLTNTNSLFETNDGAYWISSNNGIYVSKKKSRLFRHYYISNSKSNRPIFFFCRDILEITDNKYLVAVTSGQMPIIIDKHTGELLQTISLSPSLKKKNLQLELTNLLKDEKDQIWITSNHGLFQIDMNKYTIKRPTIRSEFDYTKPFMFHINKDKNHNIFVTVHNPIGLLKIDTQKDTAIFLREYFEKNNIQDIKGIDVSNENELVLSLYPSPSVYHIKENTFTKIGNNKHKNIINHEWINCGLGNGDEYLLGYGRKAISVWNKNTDTIINIDKSNGLLSNQVYELEKDKKGNIWVATGGGLNLLSADNYDILGHFEQEDGLLKNDLGALWGSTLKLLPSGEMMIAGHSFFTIFHPDTIMQTKNKTSKLQFENIFVNGHPKQFKKELNRMDTISIPYKENSFIIKFANLDNNKRSREQYKYRLQGYEEQWSFTKSNNLNFNKIPPGKYNLALGLSSDSNVKTLVIEIIPTWWQTWWFKTLFILTNIGIIYFLYAKRMEYIREKERIKAKFNEQLLETEMKMLQSQMNSHFLFNTLNSIKNYIIKNETRLAVNYLNNFAILIRKILNQSEQKFISLSSELETIELYFGLEMLRFEDRFNYAIEVDGNINPDETEVPPLLLQPFVENAIWHGLLHKGGKGKILIDIKQINNKVQYIITDNGVGRDKAESLKSKSAIHKKSYGLKLSRERLETLKHIYNIDIKFEIIDLFDDNNEAIGTQVRVKF